jgi:hypothetical protein
MLQERKYPAEMRGFVIPRGCQAVPGGSGPGVSGCQGAVLRRSRVATLEIDELAVRRLRVGELVVTDAVRTPAGAGAWPTAAADRAGMS